jgi:hypothetical protein
MSTTVSLKRQLRSLFKDTAQCALRGRGVRRAFYMCDSARVLRGVTHHLARAVFSAGTPPRGNSGDSRRNGRGGFGRGLLVDRQLSARANARVGARLTPAGHPFVRVAEEAVRRLNLTPVCAQLAVTNGRIATAADIVCLNGAHELVVVELKTGFLGNRNQPCMRRGHRCRMRPPVSQLPDTFLHRHCLQLGATLALLRANARRIQGLLELGVRKTSAVLLYVSDDGADAVTLDTYFLRRAEAILCVRT